MKYNRRLAQVNELLREAIGKILVGPHSDSEMTALTVTEVRVVSDLTSARVYVMPHRTETGAFSIESQEQLDEIAERVQRHLAPEIRLKRTPKLRFEIDDTEEKAAEVERLLNQVRNDWEDADGNSERR